MAQTIGVGIIAKNAGSTIKDCVRSFEKYVDDIVVVVDEGTTDRTARMAKKASPKVRIFNVAWVNDFSAIRNYSFSKLDTDWLLWVDADDTVANAENLPKLVEKISAEVGAIWLPYWYAFDEFGNLCFDEKTEILTDRGWYKLDNVPQDAKLATLDSEGYLEYQKPIRYIRTQWDGDMIHLNHSRQLDLMVTPKHKLLASRHNGANIYEPYGFIEAEKLLGKHFRVKKDAKWNGENARYFILPAYNNFWELKLNNGHCVNTGKRDYHKMAKRIDISLWLEFLGYFISEGSITNRDRRVIISQLNPARRKKIWHCLEQLPFVWKETQNDFYTNSVQLATYLKQYVGKGAENKRIPDEIKSLSTNLLRILIKALMFGDGDREERRYFTVSKKLADDIQEVALKAGWAANISTRQNGVAPNSVNPGKLLYIISIVRHHLRPRVNNLNRGRAKLQRGHYKGIVSCYEVPNNTLYVRRNGKACWAGNTTLYERERLLRASYGWVWQGRLHETVAPLTPCQYVRTEDVHIVHNHLAGVSRGERNFKLLGLMLDEEPENRRIWLYMGHQHFAAQQWTQAVEWYLKFANDNQTVPVEKYQALCYASKALREMGDNQAIEVSERAINLFPEYRDAYLDLAGSYLMVGNAKKALHYAALSAYKELIKEPPHVIFINPLDYNFGTMALVSDAYYQLGDIDNCLKYAEQAYKVRPHPDLLNKIKGLQEIQKRQQITRGIQSLALDLLQYRELDKLYKLCQVVPHWFIQLPEYESLKAGSEKYYQEFKDTYELKESETAIEVDITKSTNPEGLLKEIDERLGARKAIIKLPVPGQNFTMSQEELEKLITSSPGRHIINLQRTEDGMVCEYDRAQPNFLLRMFVGQGLEYWSPRTIIEEGAGGSETAAMMVVREWAKDNCLPIIYAMDNQVWDGVIYRPYFNYKGPGMPCNLFISSRVPEVFYEDIPAMQKWLWMHDTDVFDRLTPEITDCLDAIVVLSKWHAGHIKRCYPWLKEAQVVDFDNNPLIYEDDWTHGIWWEEAKGKRLPIIAIIGDGVDTTRFKEVTLHKVTGRFIWNSSPDRGLEELLNIWGEIKKAIPAATLKIYYGWNYFNRALDYPGYRDYKRKILKLVNQDGVEWVGRVSQPEMDKALMEAQIRVYPPHPFRETYGIAFLEAQAARCLNIYRMNGALGETIGNRGIPVPLDISQEELVKIIVNALHNINDYDKMLYEAREYALGRDWSIQVAKMKQLFEFIEKSK